MSIEAMKQALSDICGAKLCETNSMSSRAEMLRLMGKSIATLRQAIAEAEKEATLQELSDIGQEIERPVKSYTGGVPQYATETPDDLLRQSEREGWRYAKECEAEIKRLKELAEYRLQLLMKMPENKPVMRMLSKGEEPPTKREWVGLTDQEIWEAAGLDDLVWGRNIEAKLRERNT